MTIKGHLDGHVGKCALIYLCRSMMTMILIIIVIHQTVYKKHWCSVYVEPPVIESTIVCPIAIHAIHTADDRSIVILQFLTVALLIVTTVLKFLQNFHSNSVLKMSERIRWDHHCMTPRLLGIWCQKETNIFHWNRKFQ